MLCVCYVSQNRKRIALRCAASTNNNSEQALRWRPSFSTLLCFTLLNSSLPHSALTPWLHLSLVPGALRLLPSSSSSSTATPPSQLRCFFPVLVDFRLGRGLSVFIVSIPVRSGI
nr:uncharacterized protein LOC112296123 isoform X1 [Physcomitrium patens]|eukprot:XP_024404081.1 uncharacterized protein LOC112296123 isoform X1 [Physcomitrella patens]